MGQVICIASQKGGTGKTTTAINLAASFALFEKRTLLIDCDPSGNATTSLGINKAATPYSLFHALTGQTSWERVIIDTGFPGLSSIPATFELFSLENTPPNAVNTISILRSFVADAAKEYDYIIIDSPPSLGYLTVCALSAADFLITPTQRRILSLEGLNQLLSLIKKVRSETNPDLKIAGILLTMIENEWREAYETLPYFLSRLKGSIFRTVIPWDITLADAADFGKPGVLYDIAAPGPNAYLNLAQEMHHKVLAKTQ